MANLDKLMLKLFTDEPFYAGIVLNIRRTESRDIPTAGVRFNQRNCRFELIYNPDFLAGMKTEQAVAILKHEMMHIVFKHVTERSAPIDEYGIQIWNWATDLAINSHLVKELPQFVINKETGEARECNFLAPGMGQFKDYPAFQSSEWYLHKILNDDKIEKIFIPMPGAGTGGEGGQTDNMVGDHSGWCKKPSDNEAGQNAADDAATLEKAELRRVVKEGQKRALVQGWGNVPQSMQDMVKQLLESKIDWKSVLRYFVHGSQRADKYSSFKKYNRRYPYQQPGRRTARTAKIAIAIDQSGSVSDDMLSKFFAELNKLASYATFTVVPFDHIVHEDKIFEWKKNTKKPWERVACGGTNFDAPTDFVNENSRTYDALIVLTDMCAPTPGPCAKPRLWITTKEYESYIPDVAGRDIAIIIPEGKDG